MDIILNQPNRRRVSTDRLGLVDSPVVPSLEVESSPTPTPAGKTLPTLILYQYCTVLYCAVPQNQSEEADEPRFSPQTVLLYEYVKYRNQPRVQSVWWDVHTVYHTTINISWRFVY